MRCDKHINLEEKIMTGANCIIFIFITTTLFWGNNCLIISPQEQSCDNRGWLMLCLIWSSKCLRCPLSCTPHHLAHHSPEADSDHYYSERLVQDGIVGGREADAGGWDSPTLVPKTVDKYRSDTRNFQWKSHAWGQRGAPVNWFSFMSVNLNPVHS